MHHQPQIWKTLEMQGFTSKEISTESLAVPWHAGSCLCCNSTCYSYPRNIILNWWFVTWHLPWKNPVFGVPAKWWPLSAVLLLSLLQWKCHACLISVKGCGSTHRGLAGYWLSWCQDFGIPFVWTEWLCKSKVERSSSFHQHCDISTHSSYWRYMTNFCL